MSHNLETAKCYLAALEQGVDAATLAAFFHPQVVQEEFPNRLVPQGARRDLDALLAGHERGKAVVSRQRYEVRGGLEDGDRVALEVRWTGVLAVAIGSLAVGDEMRAYFGVFIDFRDGKILAQRNYDCFEPW